MNCPRCSGSGECVECRGKGSIACASCEGTGKRVRASTGQSYACARCKGTGSEACNPRCDSCQGTGTITPDQQKEIHEKYIMVGEPVEAQLGFRMTNGIILACVGVFIAGMAVPDLDDYLYTSGSRVFWFREYWRLVTAQFVHAGVMHLVMNMLFLFQCGPALEEAVGPWKFLGLYLLTGIVGFALSGFLAANPLVGSVGASGALMGITGLMGGLQQRFHVWNAHAIRSLVIYAIAWTIFGFIISGSGGVVRFDNWAHLGGLASGYVLSYFLRNPAARQA